jgi:hypothetical protein
MSRLTREISRDIAASCFIIVVATAAVGVTFNACASMPPKQQATIDVQAVENLLDTFQNAATQLCAPNGGVMPNPAGGVFQPTTHCTASPVVIPDAVWHSLNVGLSAAFTAQAQVATALAAWTPGVGTPPSLTSELANVQASLAAVQSLGPSTQEATLLSDIQAVIAEIQLVQGIIAAAQPSSGSAS